MFPDPINFTNNSSRKLTLNASGDIRINNSMRVNGGIRLVAGGSIELRNDLYATTGGIWLEATNDVLSGADGNNVRIENTTGPVSIRSDRIAFDGSFNSSSTVVRQSKQMDYFHLNQVERILTPIFLVVRMV